MIKHFLITEIVEILVSALIGIRGFKNYRLIFIVNAITNIPLNLLLIYVVRKQSLYLSSVTGLRYFDIYNVIVLILEIIIVFIEAIIYYGRMELDDKFILSKLFKESKVNCDGEFKVFLILSFILNLSSVLVGRLFI